MDSCYEAEIPLLVMNKKILFTILSNALILPSLTLAQGGGGGITIQSMVNTAVQTTFYIASGVVVILWVITGILFLTAQGAPEKLSTAKKALIAAIAGTVLIIIAGSAISLVRSMFGIEAGS